jgi:hypothetical protein
VSAATRILQRKHFLIEEEPAKFREVLHMRGDKTYERVCGTLGAVSLGLLVPSQALAYIDPGTSGMLSQVLYVMFYGALGLFFYMLRYIKQYVAQVKQFFAKQFGRS